MQIRKLIGNICEGYEPSLEELKGILNSDEDAAFLFNMADKVRKEFCGDDIHIRGIIEFSSYCRCECLYCGLNCHNNEIPRYRMDVDEIIGYAKEAYEAGYKTLVLQSGEDIWYTKEKISEIIKSIKSMGDIAITLSIGERDIDEYRQWILDGADRFLIKHETADEDLYNSLHPHSNFQNRIKCIRWLKELGYQTGSGFMIGLPGQNTEIIAKDIMLLKKLDVDMAGIGPFIPHQATELRCSSAGSTHMTLKAVALARILIKNIHLPATTALGVLSAADKNLVFNTGANVVMQKVQPYKYRKLYDIYPKGEGNIKTVLEERQMLESYIKEIGRTIGKDTGNSYKNKRRVF